MWYVVWNTNWYPYILKLNWKVNVSSDLLSLYTMSSAHPIRWKILSLGWQQFILLVVFLFYLDSWNTVDQLHIMFMRIKANCPTVGSLTHLPLDKWRQNCRRWLIEHLYFVISDKACNARNTHITFIITMIMHGKNSKICRRVILKQSLHKKGKNANIKVITIKYF